MSPIHFNDRFRSDDPSAKSLTPQRKHRKLLKDGSGIEVWPESVEKIFVQGLRKYWESPYATSSQSRGRSRWRNQFLVDYLKSAGVDRSKKQVASHIQVLRNMWKGEPEYHLVAGGEELYPDLPPTNVKQEEQGDSLTFGYPEYDDADSSSNGTSPNFSPPDVKTEFPPSPGVPLCPVPPDSHASFYAPTSDGLSAIPASSPTVQRPYSLDLVSSQFTPCFDYSAPANFASHDQIASGNTASQAVSLRHVGKTARLKALKLTADGMNPSLVRLDTLASLGQLAPHTPLTLKLQLGISSSSVGHGFAPTIYLTSWTHSEKCLTKVFINGQLSSSEDAPLMLTGSGEGYAIATLPESRLNQCRWLDPSYSVVVTQEIVAENQTLLFILYIMDRANGDLPSAQLLSYWKYNHGDKAAASHLSLGTAHMDVGQQAATSNSYHNDAYISPGGQVSYMYMPTAPRYAIPTSMMC
ncbi:hypothetical protein APHAL10511_001208 [Amanita phalloides]|nr:hypothetical protein APHAL10511_001208 [Amanita phalloides]